MSLAIQLYNFDYHNVYFHKPIQNTIINESKFIRTIYSNGLFSLNNICLDIPMVINSNFRSRHYFDFQVNNPTISQLCLLEDNILKRCAIIGKTANFKLTNQLREGYLKIFTICDSSSSSENILLKISGVWESESEYGITFKFVFGSSIRNKISNNGMHNRNKNKIQCR